MRAIERRTSLTREAFSSWPVAAWKRRLNASRFSSPSCSASWSSVLALKSSVWAMSLTLQVRGVAETGDHPRLDRQLHRGAFERQRGHGAGNAVEFEQDAARLHARGPEFRRTLALTHTDFGRLRRHGDVGEDANPQTALTLDRAADRAAGRFDLARGDALGFQQHGRAAGGERVWTSGES